MQNIAIEIEATNQIEADRILALYQRGKRHGELETEVTSEVWNRGWTPGVDPSLSV
ncbi:hypothetical protein [Enteractinococcus helveticum]|uniref:hypothetical protein n=1 Tax=Enteractinococcus helveticum TaxID=1837282 RepID=UPI000B19EDC2|nr:hypothetical protein [Enteractinococcus helveticum]